MYYIKFDFETIDQALKSRKVVARTVYDAIRHVPFELEAFALNRDVSYSVIENKTKQTIAIGVTKYEQ